MTDRLPPHSPEAEQGVLACCLIDPQACLPLLIERFSKVPEAFYDLRHQEIATAIIELYNGAQAVDVITVHQKLNDRQQLEQIGGISYLAALPDAATSSANISYYMDIVAEKKILRSVIHTCTNAVAKVYEYEGDVSSMLDELERDILAIRPRQGKDSVPIKELVNQALTSIEKMWALQGRTRGIPTGFIDLDRMTGGLIDGEVTIVAGYPGSGKTSFAMNLAERAMLDAKRKVGVFSLEMSALSLVTRFICSHARVSLANIKEGYLAERDFPKLACSAGQISTAEIRFEDDSDISIYQLRAKARRLRQQYGIELLVVDYLQLLSATGGARKIESRQQEVADISRGIKAISLELNIPVVALSQLNDDGKLRESRTIGQDADNVWILEPQRTEPGDDFSQAHPTALRIVKARNGPVGTVALTFLKPYTRFENAAKIEREDMPDQRNPTND